MKLWISAALSPHGNEYGLVAVVAETREEAVAKAKAEVAADSSKWVGYQTLAASLLENVDDTMREVESGVFVDWDAARKRSR